MPIAPENRARYLGGSPTSKEWRQLSDYIRFDADEANGRCECRGECGHDHVFDHWSEGRQRCFARHNGEHPVTGSNVVLTVAHLDHDPANNERSNLRAMCQRCHLAYDHEHHAATRRRRKHAASAIADFFDGDES